MFRRKSINIFSKMFDLHLDGDWKHFIIRLYIVDKSHRRSNYYTTKSLQFGWCLYWWNKPWTWFQCWTNGAVRGKDKCLDVNAHLLLLNFGYTDYDYNLPK